MPRKSMAASMKDFFIMVEKVLGAPRLLGCRNRNQSESVESSVFIRGRGGDSRSGGADHPGRGRRRKALLFDPE